MENRNPYSPPQTPPALSGKASSRSSCHAPVVTIRRTGGAAFLVIVCLFLLTDVMAPAIAVAGFLLVVSLASYLNRAASLSVRMGSAFAITAAFWMVGIIEILHTGFLPPQQLMVNSTVIVTAGSLLATLGGGGLLSWCSNRAAKARMNRRH